jgi:hypothetical protein
MAESAAGARRIATPRFPGRLQFRCPPALTATLAAAADREMTTASDYVRRAVASRLRADGYQLVGGSIDPTTGNINPFPDG